MSKKIQFLLNKSEITAGTRGASLGPEAIMTAARQKGSALFGEYQVGELPNFNYLLDTPTPFEFAKRIDGLVRVYDALNSAVSDVLGKNGFPFILAGDHGSAGGTIAGIKTAFPHKRLGVIWIDAHADIHTPYTTPSGNIHGMPLAAALGEDNIPCQSKNVDEQTADLWNQLKNVGGIMPKILPQDIVYVGIRDVEKEEHVIIERLGIKAVLVPEVREKGIGHVMDIIEERLRNCDIIYVSFDVDSMDPDLTSHGTGTPVDNGLTPEEAKTLLCKLAKNLKLICLEVVEINPCLDEKKNTMAETALDIIESVIEILKLK